MFRKFFNFVKTKVGYIKSKLSKYNWKRIGQCALAVISVVSTTFAVYFGIKYRKTKSALGVHEWLLKDTQVRLANTLGHATQLMEQNEILAEMLSRFFGCPYNGLYN